MHYNMHLVRTGLDAGCFWLRRCAAASRCTGCRTARACRPSTPSPPSSCSSTTPTTPPPASISRRALLPGTTHMSTPCAPAVMRLKGRVIPKARPLVLALEPGRSLAARWFARCSFCRTKQGARMAIAPSWALPAAMAALMLHVSLVRPAILARPHHTASTAAPGACTAHHPRRSRGHGRAGHGGAVR